LIKSFGAKSEIIDIAQDDIPKNLDKNLISKWKIEIRNNLNITHESIVYCYNGSIKAWQCPQEVITFLSFASSTAISFPSTKYSLTAFRELRF